MNQETSYTLTYDCRNADTRDTIMNLSLSFDNPSEEELRERINTWLKAVGANLIVVESLNL
jgi:hypothetical protein